jgi:hypothetical protein
MKNNFCIGLDLGQATDYTTLAVVEKLEVNGASSRDPGDRPGDRGALHLRHLERYPLRTPYPEIADRVAALIRSDVLTVRTTNDLLQEVRVPPELVIDQTGVGAPVADLLRERDLTFRSVVITGGTRLTGRAGSTECQSGISSQRWRSLCRPARSRPPRASNSGPPCARRCSTSGAR